MAIEKVKPNFLKHSPQPYTVILNSVIDLIPDLAALGLYTYLARKPEKWIIREQDIMKTFGKGRDFVRKTLKILKTIGLISTTANHDKKGHIISWTTTLHDHITENPSSGDTCLVADFNHITENPSSGYFNHITEIPTSGKTHLLDNQTHINKRLLEKKEKDINASTAIGESIKFHEYKAAEITAATELNKKSEKEKLKDEFKMESLTCKKCISKFLERFSETEFSLDMLYQECVNYWREKDALASPQRFLSHLSKRPIEKLSQDINKKIETQEEKIKRWEKERQINIGNLLKEKK